MELTAIDHRQRTFDVKPFGQLHSLDARLSLDTEYEPAPTRKNFERAIDEWDMHFQMSDDERRAEEGHQQLNAMYEMFKKLPIADQQYFHKMLDFFARMRTKL